MKKLYSAVALFLFCLLAGYQGFAATYTVTLTSASLVNCGNNCGGGNYNPCNGTNIGFTWTDGLPAGTITTQIEIQFEIGVECSAGTRNWYLNNAYQGTYADASNGCSCTTVSNGVATLYANPGNYVPGGTNTFSITSGSSCEGFYPYSGSTYAVITVTYTTNCYGYTNGYGPNYTSFTPTCTPQHFNPPSTSYSYWFGTAGVTYNFSMTGSGWSGLDMTVYYDNGSAWVPLANSTNGSISVTPSSANLAYTTELLIDCYNGTNCPPAWITNSAVLTYSIATPSTPAITQSPASGGQVCNGNGVVYTASGITVGSFNQFVWGWNAVGGNGLGIGNGGTWTSNSPGNTLYVEAQSVNGGCYAYSSPVTVLVDAASSTGSFVTSPIYSTADGTLYNGSGTALTGESITGQTGSVTGWGWGTNTTTCSANTGGYPYSVGSANMNLTCCWPGVGSGSTDVIAVTVTNGACPAAQSCISVTANAMVAPSTASVSPSLVCAPSSGNITLSYTGGFSGNIPGGVLKWYSGSCGGTLVGTGQNLVIPAPASTTNYYCAFVDPKGNLTGCASTSYTVTALPVVSAASYSICMGGSTTLSPSSGGTWVSNNTSVATVSGNTVTPVGPGSATFTFTSSSAPYCSNTTPAVSVTSIPTVSITGPTSFCGGGLATTTLSPTSGGSWVSNNTAVATVSGYTVTGTTAGGSTNFTFTSSASPNCANTTGNVSITGLPNIYGVTGGGTYCYGSSAPVGLSNSQVGVNYQLVLNGTTNVGSSVAGTGSSINFPNQTVLGTYTVIATTATNSCSQPMSGNAVVTTLAPSVTNSPGGTGATPTGGTLNGTD